MTVTVATLSRNDRTLVWQFQISLTKRRKSLLSFISVVMYVFSRQPTVCNIQQFEANIKLHASTSKIFQTSKSITIKISARVRGTQQYSVIQNEVTVK